MDGDHRPRRSSKRSVTPVSRDSLDSAALAYLERFDSTVAKLRAVLMRRVRKAAREHGTDMAEAARIVEELLARYRASGLVSDVRYATTMARGLRERGGSVRGIQRKLRSRGVSEEDAAAALGDAGVGREGDLEAARVFARKRRLGPFRSRDDRERHQRRDLAALARAGFGFDVCRAVLGADVDGFEDP
jgi:regulatory protein